jgi:dihydroneopterin aldolase/2-amino-4-hydroxy-6-hydroxymethyldihydropteridine diphosphokinase
MSIAYIGIGSNIEPEQNILKALTQLSRHVIITGISTFYRTKPFDKPDQPLFYNGVVRIDTGIGPRDLKNHVLKKIEKELGRRRTAEKSASRTIDLDILVFDSKIINDRDILVPDPDILKRPFLAIPLCELNRDLVVPGLDRPVWEIAEQFRDYEMESLIEYTEKLRRMI